MRTTQKRQKFTAKAVKSKRLSGDNNESHNRMTIESTQFWSTTQPIIARFRVNRRRTKTAESEDLVRVHFFDNPLQGLSRNGVFNSVRSSDLQSLTKVF